jgi:hypothetical protein
MTMLWRGFHRRKQITQGVSCTENRHAIASIRTSDNVADFLPSMRGAETRRKADLGKQILERARTGIISESFLVKKKFIRDRKE